MAEGYEDIKLLIREDYLRKTFNVGSRASATEAWATPLYLFVG